MPTNVVGGAGVGGCADSCKRVGLMLNSQWAVLESYSFAHGGRGKSISTLAVGITGSQGGGVGTELYLRNPSPKVCNQPRHSLSSEEGGRPGRGAELCAGEGRHIKASSGVREKQACTPLIQ